MTLIIYKGFDNDYLNGIKEQPLIDTQISKKKEVLEFTKSYKKKLAVAMLALEENDTEIE